MTAPYASGTITLTNGSNIIVGNNTGWKTALVGGGIVHPEAANGNSMPIVTVDTDTKITAATKWKGATGTYPYAIMRDTSYGQQTVDNAQALATLIQRLGVGILSDLSALTPAANKVVAFGESAEASLADLSPFGKSLIAVLNSSAAYGALGVIPNAQLPTRSRELSTAVADANLAITNGVYGVSNSALNIPVAATGSITVTTFNATNLVQIFTRVSNGDVWVRNMGGGVWGAWSKIASENYASNASSLASGAFRGWSFGSGTPLANLDANALVGNGLFFVQPGSTNTPSNGWGYILQFQREAERKTQVFYDSFSSNPRQYIRGQLAEGWSVWRTNPFAQTSTTDTTATAAMLVGAFGLGGSGVLLAATDDLNNLPIATCSYRWGSTAVPSNAPSGGSYLMEHVSFGSGGCVQTAYNLSGTNIIWHRKQAGGTWTAWKRIDGSSDTVGDVTGPASSVDNALASFSGTTGKVLKGTPSGAVTNNYLANVATATLKGRATAGIGAVEDLTPAQARTVMDVVPSVARQVRLAGLGEIAATVFAWNEAAAGCVLTGVFLDGNWGVRNYRYRAVQQTDVSGNWVTVAQA
ncbi:pyocin knob domain-containing protein [Agrobacterium tumefaciens]|uniref:pyocin knob domain-containing protein n=1 Tax=Agrobacterium tumefaciens TaxID=358 RepID=UPI003BA32BF5